MVISNMTYFWFVTALVFLFLELNTPGLFFFISFAIGSFAATVASHLGLSIVAQCLTALVVMIISFLMLQKFLKHKNLSEVLHLSSETNIDALVGAVGIVTDEIMPHKKGRVKIGGEIWRASGDTVLITGTIVYVLRIEGNTVIVKKPTKEQK
jgi:membrane protein implicated in regulation of membrane protease activity